ncbi:MAG: hypothetical protein MJ075_06110 [Oscillospiraceae bacterium]|nr:hypothetical protein [Oscillospiraceae bacterium]
MDELICQQEGWERLSRRKLEERQLEMINMQLLRARSQSSFYRAYPEKLLSLHQLQELPFMGAEELRECFPQLCLPPSDELLRLRTSGTMGMPKRVAYSQ